MVYYKHFIISLILVLCILACGKKGAANLLCSEIEQLQTTLAEKEDAKLDIASANQLIEKSTAFAQQYPRESLAPVYLFRAGDVARGIGRYNLAIQLWGKVQQRYPDFEKNPDALFLQGFTFENDLKDSKTAKVYYEKFGAQFPNHPLITSVKNSLQQLDKSPEELIKEFQKN